MNGITAQELLEQWRQAKSALENGAKLSESTRLALKAEMEDCDFKFGLFMSNIACGVTDLGGGKLRFERQHEFEPDVNTAIAILTFIKERAKP